MSDDNDGKQTTNKTIIVVITALITATVAINLTLQSAHAVFCSPKNPNVCAATNTTGPTGVSNGNSADTGVGGGGMDME
ncbi:MAG: hypothetical protein M3P08_11925 [Thermoproteota archaeon]|nr:hypothetical protein [Thermoproteota archaeon]